MRVTFKPPNQHRDRRGGVKVLCASLSIITQCNVLHWVQLVSFQTIVQVKWGNTQDVINLITPRLRSVLIILVWFQCVYEYQLSSRFLSPSINRRKANFKLVRFSVSCHLNLKPENCSQVYLVNDLLGMATVFVTQSPMACAERASCDTADLAAYMSRRMSFPSSLCNVPPSLDRFSCLSV